MNERQSLVFSKALCTLNEGLKGLRKRKPPQKAAFGKKILIHITATLSICIAF
jgi:hypothetical protein